jgi:DUF4097 and DUF4098 domain-containing protein YvlB
MRLSITVPSATILCIFGCLLNSLAQADAAKKTVAERRPADGVTQVEIVDTAGTVAVQGWDRSEVEVTGLLGGEVERLDIQQAGNVLTVHVVEKKLNFHLDWGKTALTVKVPKNVALRSQMVSADLRVGGVNGHQELQSVSGDVYTAAAADARIRTVSGDIHLDALATSKLVQLSTVSGDAIVTGNSTGELSFRSVSGDGHVKAGVLSRVALKTVSGDLAMTSGLAPDGRFEAESVSGDLRVDFSGGLPPAEYEISSLSGDLSTCDGRKGVGPSVGPGSRLTFRQGAATARVHIDTKSGDVALCGR